MFSRQKSIHRKIILVILLFLIALPVQSISAMQGVAHFAGDGSADNPYRIDTAEDLLTLSEVYADYAGQVFLQVADIDLTGSNWTPIGNADAAFQAVYDGGGYSISGLTINLPEQSTVGLFGFIGESGVVKDVNLDDGTVTGNYEVGGIAGVNYGLILGSNSNAVITGRTDVGGLVGENYGSIHDSHVIGYNSVTCITYVTDCDVVSELNYVGGLIGNNSGYVHNSSSSASVKGSGSAGGLVGGNSHLITGSYASGDVHSSAYFTGGLVGYSNGIVLHSYATGNVRATNDARFTGGLIGEKKDGEIAFSYATGNVEGRQDTGGLVGNNVNSKIRRSYAIGSVHGTSNVGGLVGTNIGEVEYSYATGEVQSSSTVAGGLIGSHQGSVRNSYATGNVVGNFAGGLIGSTIQDPTILVEHTYSSGQVQTEGAGGGFIGLLSHGTFISSYWNMSLSGYETSAGIGNVDEGITGLSASEMTDPNSFVGWDFVNTWEVAEDNSGPTLRAFTDRTGLEDAIYEAEMILSGVMIGNRPGEYPKAALDVFNEHIYIARQVLNDSGITQQELDEAEYNLIMAIDIFKASINPVKLIFAETVENDRFIRLFFNAKIGGISYDLYTEGFFINDPNVSISDVGFNEYEGTIELALSDPLQSTSVKVTVLAGAVYFNGSLVENESTVRVMTQSAIEQLQMDLQIEGNNEGITLENIARYMSARDVDVNGDGITDAADVQYLMRFITSYVIN